MYTCYDEKRVLRGKMGSKKSGRPGGNPDLYKSGFKKQYDWEEPCTAVISVRVPPSISKEFKKLPNWQETIRRVIAAELEKNSPEGEQKN